MRKLIGLISLIGFLSGVANAADFSSSNFIVKDPSILEVSAQSQSANFQVRSNVPYISAQPSASANFSILPGAGGSSVTLPVLAATPGPDYSQISLSWAAVIGVANATYELGISTTVGGPYTYDSPQTTLSAVKTGLSFSQSYNFVIRVKDGLGAVVGLSAEVSAIPQSFPSTSTGAGGQGGGSPAYQPSEPQTEPPVVVPTTPTSSIPPIQPGQPTFPIIFPPPTTPIQPPIESFVPKVTPFAFRTPWLLLPPEPIKEFALRPLPNDIKRLAGAFPQLSKLFKEVGITKFNDLQKLKNISLNIPGLTDVLALPTVAVDGGNTKRPRDLRVAELSPELKKKFPVGVLFTSLAGGTINAGGKLSIAQDGSSHELIRTISGKTIELSIKPIAAAKSVTGYLIFKAKRQSDSVIPEYSSGIQGDGSRVVARDDNWVAKLFGVETAHAATTIPIETALVLNQFEFTDPDKDGIYTAQIDAPVVAGDYEIITLVTYQDPAKGTQALRLLTVVDPEGYVYEASAGREIRIPGAIATLDWLNPDTKAYELWPAIEFQQENPQITGVTGQYSFLVPSGFYQLKITAPGYADYNGKPFEVTAGEGVHENIELHTATWFLNLVDWRTLGLIAIALLLLYNFYKDKLREKREALILELKNKGL